MIYTGTFRAGRMRRLILLLSALLLTIPSFSQAKHPFTFEDMMALKRVGAPQVSPDGKWVLFSAVDVDLAANTRTPHIWIVPISGGQEREIIKEQQADSPRWAPDGKRFAFTSSRQGGSQIWIADFDGATGTVTGTHQFTSIATEVAGPIWSPDGKNIAFTRFTNAGGSSIVVVPAGGTETTVTAASDLARNPAYTRDGTRIAYVGLGGGKPALTVVVLGGGPTLRLLPLTP
jgi:Tol biopolymer transport system component